MCDERHAVVAGRASKLLDAAREIRRDDVVRQGGDRVAHDGRVMLAVDHHDRPHSGERLRVRAGRAGRRRKLTPLSERTRAISEL